MVEVQYVLFIELNNYNDSKNVFCDQGKRKANAKLCIAHDTMTRVRNKPFARGHAVTGK